MASTEADELVIARRAHGVTAAAHLGSVARTVLLCSHCPVRVLPASQAPDTSDLELESAGAALT
jgi:nucleotide-binding universal stress UspA family protein